MANLDFPASLFGELYEELWLNTLVLHEDGSVDYVETEYHQEQFFQDFDTFAREAEIAEVYCQEILSPSWQG